MPKAVGFFNKQRTISLLLLSLASSLAQERDGGDTFKQTKDCCSSGSKRWVYDATGSCVQKCPNGTVSIGGIGCPGCRCADGTHLSGFVTGSGGPLRRSTTVENQLGTPVCHAPDFGDCEEWRVFAFLFGFHVILFLSFLHRPGSL